VASEKGEAQTDKGDFVGVVGPGDNGVRKQTASGKVWESLPKRVIVPYAKAVSLQPGT
jgi:hypothetical protein